MLSLALFSTLLLSASAQPSGRQDTLKLDECISVCEMNTCEKDGPNTMGTNQMLTCTNACFMRYSGVSNSECLGHCDRNGGSGCSLIVNDVRFSMCGVISGSPCFHGNHVSVSDCELGCNSYSEELNWSKLENLGCGYNAPCTDDETELNIGIDGGYASADGVTVDECKATCEASTECAGFNYQKTSPTKCWFRRSVTCKTISRDDRDCYALERSSSGSIFSTSSEGCIKEVFDIGQVFGRKAHTIHVKLEMPEYSNPRQWILNLGQETTGANHWIWRGESIQFGSWNGPQIQQVDINACTDLTTTFDGENTLTLYCNGEFLGQIENSNLNIQNSNLAVAGNQRYEVPRGNFGGCVHYVEVWDYDLSSTEVASLTDDAVHIPEPPAASAGKCWIYYHEDSLGPLALFTGNRAGNTWFDGSYAGQTCKERAEWWQGQAWHQGLKNSAEKSPYPGSFLKQEREDAYAIISGAPAFWETCRWQDASPHEKSGAVTYMGYACADNEILVGLELSSEGIVDKIKCCSVGGHSSVTGHCSIDKAQSHKASCDGDKHMVFNGLYDKQDPDAQEDAFHEVLAGRCCEVQCHEKWCGANDWGVSDECKTIEFGQDKGSQNLECPSGYLMTAVHEDVSNSRLAKVHGVQRIDEITCCKLDTIAAPTQAPSVSPSRSPSPSPTSMPTPAPTTGPSTSPTTAPSSHPTTSPTTAPTSVGECLAALRDASLTDKQFLEGIEDCLPCVVYNQRRNLEGRLLNESHKF